MELGKHIANQLNLNDRGDWLRHWLAHHVAELVRTAETTKDIAARREATAQATEAILKIWEHRDTLPGDVTPMSQYREAIAALNELRSNSRWQLFLGPPSKQSGAASRVYFRFPRLMEALVLLPSLRRRKQDQPTSKAIRKFLEKDEQTLLAMFEVRVKILGEKEDKRAGTTPKDDYHKCEEAAKELIDRTIADLKAIRDVIPASPPPGRPSSYQ